jgi:hypothetical protein
MVASACYQDFPARIFDSVVEAQDFTRQLTELQISFMVKLVTSRKRLNLPMQTVVILLDNSDECGVVH